MAVELIQPTLSTPVKTSYQKGSSTGLPTATPMSFFCQFVAGSLPSTLDMAMVCISRSPSQGFGGYEYFELAIDRTTHKVKAQQRGPGFGGGASSAYGPAAISVDTWYSAGAVFTSNTSRKVYQDGTGYSDTGTASTPRRIGDLYVGGHPTVTSGEIVREWRGCLANVTVWDVALSDADMTNLHGGTDPKTIQPSHIIWHQPLADEATQLDVYKWDGAAVTQTTDAVLNVAQDGDTIDCSFGSPSVPEVPDLAALYTAPVLIGLNYCSQGQLLRPDHGPDAGAANGPAFGKLRRIHKYTAQLYRTRSISFGIDFDTLRMQPLRTAGGTTIAAPTLYSGIIDGTIEAKYDFENQIAWEICRPYPATVAAIGGYGAAQDK